MPHMNLKIGDYVQIIEGNFKGMYATIVKKLDDEFVIHYFQQKAKWWVLKDGDKDCCKGVDLIGINDHVSMDGRSHIIFN